MSRNQFTRGEECQVYIMSYYEDLNFKDSDKVWAQVCSPPSQTFSWAE